MPKALRWVALALALAATAGWLLGGAHRGWTRTSVAVEKTDEITGLTYREYEDRFVPGIELLGGAWALSLLLFGTSLLWSRLGAGPDRPRAA